MLLELDRAFLAHFQQILEVIDSSYTQDRVILSLVDDRETHFKLLEKQNEACDVESVRLPFAVLVRESLQTPDWTSHSARGAVACDTIATKDTNSGTAIIVRALPIEMTYRLKLYDSSFNSLSNFTEFWFLSAGSSFTKFSFNVPEADNEPMDVTFHIEPPESINPFIEETRDMGLIFEQAFPLTLRTVLVGRSSDGKIILTNNYTIDMASDIPDC